MENESFTLPPSQKPQNGKQTSAPQETSRVSFLSATLHSFSLVRYLFVRYLSAPESCHHVEWIVPIVWPRRAAMSKPKRNTSQSLPVLLFLEEGPYFYGLHSEECRTRWWCTQKYTMDLPRVLVVERVSIYELRRNPKILPFIRNTGLVAAENLFTCRIH